MTPNLIPTDSDTLQTTLREVSERIFQDYSLDLFEIRDLHTGAPVGRFHEEVFLSALCDEGLLDDSEDGSILSIEELADALLVRSLASARPSPTLNRPTPQSLRRFLDSDPLIVCAYLLNRYHLSDWRKLNHRSDSWFDDMLHRVKVWEKLTQLDDGSDQFESTLRSLCHWLLELDSKCNLHELSAPREWFDTFLTLPSLESFDLMIRDFALIAVPLIRAADERFQVGNRMASSAFVKSWFDNPTLAQRKIEIANNKRQRLHDRYGSAEIGMLIEAERLDAKRAKAVAKAKKDSRIIKGRSSRSKAAKLVNKHSAALDSLFKTLSDVVVEPKAKTHSESTKPVAPVASRSIGLPKFVKG